MLTDSAFLITLIVILIMVTLINPLILLEGFTNLLKRRWGLSPTKEIERTLLSCHQTSLEKMEKQVQTEVREELALMARKHEEMLAKLGVHPELEAVTEKYLEETKLALSAVVEKAEKRVNDELTEELKKTLTEIGDYKKKRLQKIDDEITNIVEKTIYLTLGKGLSLEDQIDTIYDALAEAKEEGFFEKNAQ